MGPRGPTVSPSIRRLTSGRARASAYILAGGGWIRRTVELRHLLLRKHSMLLKNSLQRSAGIGYSLIWYSCRLKEWPFQAILSLVLSIGSGILLSRLRFWAVAAKMNCSFAFAQATQPHLAKPDLIT
jgi:hypothetical protein